MEQMVGPLARWPNFSMVVLDPALPAGLGKRTGRPPLNPNSARRIPLQSVLLLCWLVVIVAEVPRDKIADTNFYGSIGSIPNIID
jgi:hypothetical protein